MRVVIDAAMTSDMVVTTHVDGELVAVSVVAAMLASYAALDLIRRSADAIGWRRRVVVGGAGVLGASVSLAVVTRPAVSRGRVLSAAGFMGCAVASMHYLGMASMQMAAVIHWQIALVALSIAIGFLASLIALSLFVHIGAGATGFGFARRIAAAVLLGVGVAGLRYTAMAAATFTPIARHGLDHHGQSTGALVIMLTLGAGVMLAVYHRRSGPRHHARRSCIVPRVRTGGGVRHDAVGLEPGGRDHARLA